MRIFVRFAVSTLFLAYLPAFAADKDEPRVTHFGNHPIETVRDPKGGSHDLHIVKGPWGTLQYSAIHLEVPPRYLEFVEPAVDGNEWVFPDTTPDVLAAFLSRIGSPPITADEKVATVYGDVFFYPSHPFVENLTAGARAEIAAWLARDSRNITHQNPCFIDAESPAQWFREAGLDDDTANRLAGMCYERNGVKLFSDLSTALATQETLEGRERILRAFTRVRSLMARLMIADSDDLGRVVDYWSAGHKRKNLLTLLESVANIPEIDTVDVAHLLPPIPRMLLYTYPSITDVAYEDRRDCHWTCLNFFANVMGPVLRSPRVLNEKLLHDMERVDGDPMFGDTLVLVHAETREILHSMTYIAADIVFTKNGSATLQPWMLMLYQDALARYAFDLPVELGIWRPK